MENALATKILPEIVIVFLDSIGMNGLGLWCRKGKYNLTQTPVNDDKPGKQEQKTKA